MKVALVTVLLAAFGLCSCANQPGRHPKTGAGAVSYPAQGLPDANPGLKAVAGAEPASAPHAMVVTAQHLATRAGEKILKEGGNAIDAAVAIGYALAVIQPCCGNIGGGGFMVIHLAGGKNLFLNFREKAPLQATTTMYQNKQGHVIEGLSTESWLAIGVPGTVMGLNAALARFGTMPLSTVMKPAIRLAYKGFVLRKGDARILHTGTEKFRTHPNAAGIFLDNGQPLQAGDRLVQKDLARTLQRIAKKGNAGFYQGPVAQSVVDAAQAHGGLLTMKDFAKYTVEWRKPIHCEYRGYEILSAAPPSSGGTTICEILQILKAYPLSQWGYGSVQATHYMVEAMRHAFADRNTYLGDPDFVDNPVQHLLSPEHAAEIRRHIQPRKATPSSKVQGSLGAREGLHTTHYSVVDAEGNAVAVTYTLNFYFGMGGIAGDTGFFLNNEMNDFTSKPGVPNAFGLVQGRVNRIEPGKRPLSSMSPTIVLRGGKVFMVTGSPGGSTIITTTLETILNVIDFGMNMQQSVNARRVHQQWLPAGVMVEKGYLTPKTRKA